MVSIPAGIRARCCSSAVTANRGAPRRAIVCAITSAGSRASIGAAATPARSRPVQRDDGGDVAADEDGHRDGVGCRAAVRGRALAQHPGQRAHAPVELGEGERARPVSDGFGVGSAGGPVGEAGRDGARTSWRPCRRPVNDPSRSSRSRTAGEPRASAGDPCRRDSEAHPVPQPARAGCRPPRSIAARSS